MCSFLQVTELLMDLRQATNMNWYKRIHVGWHAVTNCIWPCVRHHDIMRTLSYTHTHTIIQIQSYTYNPTHTSKHIQSCNDVAHGYMKHSFEKLYLSLVCAPASVQFSGLIVGSLVSAPATRAVYGIACQNFCFCACHLAVDQVDFENDGVCACNRWSSRDWLSDPWALRLPPVQFTRLMVRSLVSALRLPPGSLPGWFSKCGCPRLPPVKFSGLIVGSLVCLPPVQFTRVMVGSSCLLVLCACHPCSWPNWFSNCWSVRPPSVQFTKLILKMLVCVCAPATGAVKRIDCQIPGLCACHLCSLPEWWLDPWSLHLPPMQYQIASQVLRLLPLH